MIPNAWRDYPPLCGYRCRGLWWFRVFGYGLHAKRLRDHPPLFSERYGYVRKLRLLGWSFGVLTPRTCGI